jgi:zinc protease
MSKRISLGFVLALSLTSSLMVGTSQLPFASLALAETSETQKETKGPTVSSFSLANGLKVVVIPDRRAPVVTHMLWYRVGSADEKPGKSGIAHYLEHMMFMGTKTVANGEFSAKVAEIGGEENAFTSTDYTAYYQKVTPKALEDMMRLEADRMSNLVLTEKNVLTERDVIQEERRSRTDNNPGSLLNEAVQAALFQNHPYGTPVIGWEHEVSKLTKDDAIEFYNKYYTPNNAVLVVAGDVTAERVKELAEKIYGKVKRRAEPGKRLRPQEPEPKAARTVSLSDARVTSPSWQRTFLVPSYTTAKPGEAEALDILGEILGGSTTSRLYKQLVISSKLAAGAGGYYQGSALDDSRFLVYATPRQGVTLAQIEAEMDKVIDLLLEKGVSDKEVARGINRQLKSVIFARDSQSTLARIYGASLMVGETLEDIKQWPERISKVTADDVNAVARKYLKKTRSVTGYLRPEKGQK